MAVKRNSGASAAKLLILAGPPGAGKSTLAKSIQKMLGFHWLQADRILSELRPDSDRGKADRDIAYHAMHVRAEELLRSGSSVVLDATYGPQEHRRAIELLAAALKVPLFLVELTIAPDVAVARFRQRIDHPASDLNETRVRAIAERYPFGKIGLTVAAETSEIEALKLAEEYLSTAEPVRIDGSWSEKSRGYSS